MKGRPKGTNIRKNISWLLKQSNYSYGYEILKDYNRIFGFVMSRTLYYNLKSGVLSGEFIVMDVRKEIGTYTWGSETERVYYTSGPYAEYKKLSEEEEKNIASIKSKMIELDWMNIIDNMLKTLMSEVDSFAVKKNKIKFQEVDKIQKKLLLKIDKLKEWCSSRVELSKINERIDEISKKIL